MSGTLQILEDACERLPHTTKPMFGGHGLFAPNGGIFACIVDEDRIVLKFADEKARSEFEELGGKAWTYNNKMTMKEWILIPESLYDDTMELREWATRAHRLAPPKAKKSTAKKKAPASKPASRKPPARKKISARSKAR